MELQEITDVKVKEYADSVHQKAEELYGKKLSRAEKCYRNADIRMAFEAGWNEAVKCLTETNSKHK